MSRRLDVRLGRGADGRSLVAARFDLRVLAVIGGGLLLTAAAVVVAVGWGDFPISPGDVLGTLAGRGSAEHEFIVLELRLPRVLTAVLAGAALALSGALLQALTRNALVAPDIIGINAGAAFFAVSIIVLGFPLDLLMPGALVGATIAAVLVYGLSYRGGVSPYRLVLVGIAINAAFAAGISYMLTRGEIMEVQRATVWLVGSLHSADWPDVRMLAVAVLVLGPLAVLLGRQLDALGLGDDLARSVGAPVERTRIALALIAVTLAAIAVSACGPIGFVAFVAPHIARRLARASGTGILPAAMVIGAFLVLVSDIVAQRLFSPTQLPVGIVTSVLGAPYFLYLLARANRLGQAV